MKKYFFLAITLTATFVSMAQDIPQHISYTRIYDFIDELANDGIIEINSVVKPYSRQLISRKLEEAKVAEASLNSRQMNELNFFLDEYAPEQDRLPEREFPLFEGENSRIDLVPPVFLYRDSIFRARIQPILGMNIYINGTGQINQRWYGADFQAMIGQHISVYGSLRDISFAASSGLNPRLSEPTYLTAFPGYEYKEPNDFSDSRGGIKFAWKWGSTGLIKDNIVWGDNYNGSNILSGRAPWSRMIVATSAFTLDTTW